MASSTSISPFAQPGAPPPPVVVLLDVAELHLKPNLSLLAFEDLPVAVSSEAPPASSVRYKPYNLQARIYGSMVARPPLPPATPLPSHQSELSTSSSLAPSQDSISPPAPNKSPHISSSAVAVKIRIERPTGAGRTHLSKLVKWEPAILKSITSHARLLVRKHLDGAICFKDQDDASLNQVRAAMVSKFACLDDYEGMWPLDNMMLSLLKYSSSRKKGTTRKKAIDTIRSTIGEASSFSSSRARRLGGR